VRAPIFRASLAFPGELVVDNFAGGGGASEGIERAIGRPVDIAINHSREAIAMHQVNHPHTKHFCEDIWAVDPVMACAGKRVGLAWFSPDCTHFSRAKGAKPVDKNIRGLAWVVIRWAESVRPRIILLENVEEFTTWGPLGPNDRPDPTRAGEHFRNFCGDLVELGYRLEFKTLVAADYGTPTTRKRIFMIARCDGGPLEFPIPTHGEGRSQPWRTAAEIIDWSLPCRSIFGRQKPLAEATMRRIATGMQRYVIESADPFIIPLTHQGADRAYDLGQPLRTVTAANRGEFALIAPTLMIQHGRSVGRSLLQPVGTVTAGGGGSKHAVVAAFLAKHYGGMVGHHARRPLGTVTSKDHHSLVTAFLTKFYGTSTGIDVRRPLPTVTSGGKKGGGHLAEVRAFLVKYYKTGSQMQGMRDPLHTVTAKSRFGLVTILGQQYRIVDIGMRMLQPHELFAAQGFPDDYEIAPEFNGRPMSKTDQIDLCGNSVCPPVAEALVSSAMRS
jgi:DNA (cytosine-5)-methyltransferase 1